MRVIDVRHLGNERVIGCWEVERVLIDPGPTSCLQTLLDELGEQQPRAVLLTHIHLDHAGASGSLVERWPDLEVYVHENGVEHMAEPDRLLKSARRLYGDDMDRLWGEMVPVPERNLRVLTGGETVLGEFDVAYTPGHASHHVSYRYGDTAFVGDTGGVRIAPGALTIPPTPPPDIDIEAWHESIEKIRAWRPTRIAITHFGDNDRVQEQLAELDCRLDEWAEWAREQEEDAFTETVRDAIRAGAPAEWFEGYIQAAAPEQVYGGLTRYWKKRAEAVPPPAAPPVS